MIDRRKRRAGPGLKKRMIFPAAAGILILLGCLTAFAQDQKVFDYADVLSEEEEEDLQQTLAQTAETWSFDLAVLTVPDTDGRTPEEFARKSYEGLGYGYGSDSTGVLFLLSMGERDWEVYFSGEARTTINSYGLSCIREYVVPLLSDGDYYEAFMRYAGLCEDFIRQKAEVGTPYGYDGYEYREPFPFLYRILIGCAAGLAAAALVLVALWSQLKTVKASQEAAFYVVPGSFRLERSRDMFLYKTRTRVRIERDSGGGGRGGGGHSGHASSGGGGKF